MSYSQCLSVYNWEKILRPHLWITSEPCLFFHTNPLYGFSSISLVFSAKTRFLVMSAFSVKLSPFNGLALRIHKFWQKFLISSSIACRRKNAEADRNENVKGYAICIFVQGFFFLIKQIIFAEKENLWGNWDSFDETVRCILCI